MPKEATLMQKGFVEAVGAFIFVFVGAGAVIATQYLSPTYPSLLIIALANGIGLALAVSFAMNISGGHINPAVTLAMLATKRIKAHSAAIYIIAQVIGATLAGIFLVMLYPPAIGLAVHYGAPSLSGATSVMQGIIFEAIMTFIVVFMVFGTAVDSRAPKIAGFGIGLAVMVDVLAGGPFTGAAMNPARAIGPALASLYFNNWYVYWIGPIVGAFIAALLYEYVVLKK